MGIVRLLGPFVFDTPPSLTGNWALRQEPGVVQRTDGRRGPQSSCTAGATRSKVQHYVQTNFELPFDPKAWVCRPSFFLSEVKTTKIEFGHDVSATAPSRGIKNGAFSSPFVPHGLPTQPRGGSSCLAYSIAQILRRTRLLVRSDKILVAPFPPTRCKGLALSFA